MHPPIVANCSRAWSPGYCFPCPSTHVGYPWIPALVQRSFCASQSMYETFENASPNLLFWFLQWEHHSVPNIFTPLSVRHWANASTPAEAVPPAVHVDPLLVHPATVRPNTSIIATKRSCFMNVIYTKTKSSPKWYLFVDRLQYREVRFLCLFLDSPWEYLLNIKKLTSITKS